MSKSQNVVHLELDRFCRTYQAGGFLLSQTAPSGSRKRWRAWPAAQRWNGRKCLAGRGGSASSFGRYSAVTRALYGKAIESEVLVHAAAFTNQLANNELPSKFCAFIVIAEAASLCALWETASRALR